MDDVRVARVTHQILLAAAGVLVLMILTSPILNSSPLLPALIYAAFLLVILSALVLVRLGRFRTAGIISCVALWVMATALVVSDVVLPRSTGAKLVENMRMDREDLKVLYVSGHAEDTIIQHGVLVGGVDFLAKPFTIESLTAKVGEILSRSSG